MDGVSAVRRLLTVPTAHISLDKYTIWCNPGFCWARGPRRRFEDRSQSSPGEGELDTGFSVVNACIAGRLLCLFTQILDMWRVRLPT